MKRMARKILRCNIKSAKIHTVKKNNNNNKLRHVLGIETSCDDTGIAIVDEHGTILAEGLSSQWDVHEQYGGVYPLMAARAHENNFQHVYNQVISEYKQKYSYDINNNNIDAVAVTAGPGLAMCLNVGVRHATRIANDLNVPLMRINHLEAHVLMARIENYQQQERIISGDSNDNSNNDTNSNNNNLKYPFLVLLVSGGHCMLLVAKGIGRFETLGATLDDSIGEAFDKVARFLGLGFNENGGGPAIEKLAIDGDEDSIKFPIPLAKHKNCNFSFSGLKTSVKYATEKLLKDKCNNDNIKKMEIKANIAASFQKAAITHLKNRLEHAVNMCEKNSKNDKEYDNISSIVVCGGVAANKYLRNQLNDLCENLNIDIIYPAPKYCTDNGVMVAWAGMERLIHDDYTIPPVPQSSLDRFQKLKLEQKNKMKKNENSEEDDYELLEFYPSWAL